MSTGFSLWLQRHGAHLADYTCFEIAQVALAAGFSLADICPEGGEWLTRSKRRIRLWESPFFEKWLRAALAQNGREDEQSC